MDLDLHRRLGSTQAQSCPHQEHRCLLEAELRDNTLDLKYFVIINVAPSFLQRNILTVAAAVGGAAHRVPEAVLLPLPAGHAAGEGGASGGSLAVVPLSALQVAHALVDLWREEGVTLLHKCIWFRVGGLR